VDRVRHVGDPVAAVIAREELTAFEALDLIDVEYEILPTISDPQEALATPEPRIHDYGDEGNIHKRVALEFGDVEKGFCGSGRSFRGYRFSIREIRTCRSSSTLR
jgi:CO/xanthine dehydrogenase Mo-binding subunit